MSELTQRQLQEISKHLEEHLSLISEAEMERDQQTYCTFRPSELHSTKEAIDELLALRSRDAGDEEVEKWHKKIKDAIQIDYFDPDWDNVPTVLIDKLRDGYIARGQQLREARDELVGLLKYLFRNQDLQSDRAILSDESRRILEIVEGK